MLHFVQPSACSRGDAGSESYGPGAWRCTVHCARAVYTYVFCAAQRVVHGARRRQRGGTGVLRRNTATMLRRVAPNTGDLLSPKPVSNKRDSRAQRVPSPNDASCTIHLRRLSAGHCSQQGLLLGVWARGRTASLPRTPCAALRKTITTHTPGDHGSSSSSRCGRRIGGGAHRSRRSFAASVRHESPVAAEAASLAL